MVSKFALGILIVGITPSALADFSGIELGDRLKLATPQAVCDESVALSCNSQFNSQALVGIHRNLSLNNIATSLLPHSPFMVCDRARDLEDNHSQNKLSGANYLRYRPWKTNLASPIQAITNSNCSFSWQQQLKRQSIVLETKGADRVSALEDGDRTVKLKQNFPTVSRSSLIVSFPQSNSTFVPPQTKLANPAPETQRIASPFGWRNRPYSNQLQFHQGIDYGAPYGSPVVAVGNGIVTKVVRGCADFGNLFCGGQLGNWVEIDHGNGKIGTYGHLKYGSIAVTEGMRVRKKQPIALVGSSGWSTGAHLDFRFKVNGKHENPANYVMAIEQKQKKVN